MGIIRLILLITLLPNFLFAQKIEKQVIGSSGGNLQTNSGSIDFVIGEMLVSQRESKQGSISEGFLHSYKIYAQPLSTNSIETSELSMEVFPNPTTDFISIKNNANSAYNYSLLNASGKLVLQGLSSNTIQQLDFTTISTGVYYLLIEKENKLINKFKVIKAK